MPLKTDESRSHQRPNGEGSLICYGTLSMKFVNEENCKLYNSIVIPD